ncbi:penicillin-binding protein activator [Limibaculum sp. M0105]|uniref:Penicillin-binding protein activator n=1 Tax=Thermohalobaculum xanthum TaxID=2753746 RepID=A0A8J7SFN2_9RHOB|nr:penicillin-binding protein activator [Thermohalobaculum xanthum]MBK0400483.1 penicillin-binding protein activator [Thermohalobaculum xanthum]
MLARALNASPGLGLVVGLLLALSACAPRSSAPSVGAPQQPAQTAPAPTVPRAGPAKVAILAPLGAANEKVSSDARAIVNAAQHAAQARGTGLIDLRVYDTAGDLSRTAAVARQAVNDGAVLILGPLFGANTPAVADAVAGRDIMVISFSTDSSVAGVPIFVSGYLPEVEAERILGFAARQGLTTIGVYAPQTPYGEAALRGAESAAPSVGSFIATRRLYPRSFRDIQETVGDFAQDARASGVQAVLLPDSGDGLKIVGSFLDFNGLAPAQVKYLGLGQWETRATLTEPALRGGWFAGADPVAVQDFARDYSARFGATPPFIAVLGHDAVQVAVTLAADARRSGVDRPFTAEAIARPEGFMGALGPFRFEPDGTSRRALAVLEVGPRGFDVLDPAPVAFGPGL